MKDLFKVDLQLFADGEPDENVVDSPELDDEIDNETEFNIEDDSGVDYQDSDSEDNEDEFDIESEENSDVADPNNSKQSPKENAQFKKMRLRAEEEARKKIEAEFEQQKKELEKTKLDIEQKQAEKKILDEYLNPQKVSDYAYDNDVSEQQARKMLEFEAKNIIMTEKNNIQDKFNKLQAQKNALRKDRYYSLLEAEVDAIVQQRPDYDYETVYYHLKGKKSDELEKKLSKSIEKRTVANIHDRSRRKTISGGSSSNASISPTHVLSKEGMEMSQAFGHDPRDIAKYVKSSKKRR